MRRLIGISVEPASHRLASCLRLTFALALVLGLLPRMGHAAPTKESGSESPTAGAVYFDPDTMRFAGPLDTGSDRTAKVFTLLPGNSRNVEIIYWSKPKGKPCPYEGQRKTLEQAQREGWTLPERAVRRAALRGSQNGDGRFEFIATIGPLRVNVDYCFHLGASTPKPLSQVQKSQISKAIRETLKAANAWARSDASPHAGTCKQDAALSGRALTRCELAAEFGAQLIKLDPEAGAWEVVGPDGSTAISVSQAFEKALLLEAEFRGALEGALSDLINSIPRYVTYASERESLQGLTGATYDPLAGLELADVIAVAPPAVKKSYKGLASTTAKAEWAKLVWSDRDAFIAAKAWAKLKGKEKQDTLRAFFLSQDGRPRNDQPTALAFSNGDVQALLGEVPVGEPIAKSAGALATALAPMPSSETLRGLPPKPGLAEIARYVDSLSALKGAVEGIQRGKDGIAKLVSGNSPTADFIARLQQLEPVTGFGAFAWEPTLEQRFPLYASADLGLAGTLIPIRDRDPRLDIVAYFGVNLYFNAVDKDEPVRKNDEDKLLFGRNFRRRFAVMGGFSVVRPRMNGDLGIAGILRNQVLLFGAGYRVLDYLRVGGGVMLYQQRSPNPLSDKTLLRTSPYISLSMDIDVIGTIRDWYTNARGSIN